MMSGGGVHGDPIGGGCDWFHFTNLFADVFLIVTEWLAEQSRVCFPIIPICVKQNHKFIYIVPIFLGNNPNPLRYILTKSRAKIS